MKHHRESVLCLAACLAALSLLVIPAVGRADASNAPALAQNGASNYRILLRENASPSEQFAATELQTHFDKCTGAKLEIVNGPAKADSPAIIIGCGEAAAALGVAPTPEELGEQGCVIRTVAPHIVIAGTPGAGTLYGVCDFIEKTLGVRWYAPGVTTTPHADLLPLPQEDRLVKPAFLWRHTGYAWPGADDPFYVHVRENNGEGGPDAPYGLKYEFDGRCHSYFRFINPDEFFDTHPEYFSEIGGVRRREETQLCLTNPEVLDIVTERMLQRMADMPNARQHNFSQMDYYNYCECEKCRAINEQYGSNGGTQYWFLNQLAERTAKVYPDKQIGTLAYMYTEEPPKGIKMHPNVAVWLCHMFPSCDSHSIQDCPLNADYKRRAEAWGKICNHLYIWHYITDFAHYYNPFPNLRGLVSNLRYYRDLGVEGIYLQGMGNGGGGGEWSLLRPYFGAKLLCDPGQDPEALIQDFLGGYYGAAADPLYRYITLLHDKVANENIHMHLYTNPAQGYLPDETVAQAMSLFDEAEAAVKDDAELLERVRVARMPLTYARIFPRNGYRFEKDRLLFNGKFTQLPETMEFLERMKRHGFQDIREIEGNPEQMSLLCMVLNAPMPAPSIANAHLSLDIVPFLGGRVLRITDLKSGQCITANNVTRNLFFPFAGGEETRLDSLFRPQGMFNQYDIAEKAADRIVLKTKVGSVEVRRTIALVPDKPALTILSEATNRADKPQNVILRSHMEYDLGALQDTRIRFTTLDGKNIERDMAPIIAGLREGEHYLDQQAPAGKWTFTGSKGLEVTQTFDEANLDFTWLYAYPDYLNELEAEVWLRPTVLQPGETLSLNQTIEIRPL